MNDEGNTASDVDVAMTIGVGIVGLGFGQVVHLPAFQRLPQVRLVGVASATRDTARRVTEAHHLPQEFSNWQQLVACPDIHAVSIATPPNLHHDIAVAALRAGKAVLCEKPLALNSRQAKTMLDLARASGKIHMVGFEFREIPAWRLAKQIIDSGDLGEIRLVNISWIVHSWSDPSRPWSWRADRKQGGGVLSGWGVHCFDYLEWLMTPVQSLTAQLSIHLCERRDHAGKKRRVTGEDVGSVLMELQDGTSVYVSLSSVVGAGKGHWIEIFGARKTLIFGSSNLTNYGQGYEVYVEERGKGGRRRIPIPSSMRVKKRFSDGRVAPFHALAKRFIEAVQTQGPSPSPSFEEGYRAQLLMDLAIRANDERCWLKVPPVQRKET